MRIGAVVFETLQPLLDGIRSDIASLAEIVSQQNETLIHLNDSVVSLMNEFDEYKSEVKSDVVALNYSISNVLGDELSLINEKIDKLQLTLDSLDTKIDIESTSLETQVISSHAKLDSLNDLISEDIMCGLSSVADRICDKIEENEEKIRLSCLK